MKAWCCTLLLAFVTNLQNWPFTHSQNHWNWHLFSQHWIFWLSLVVDKGTKVVNNPPSSRHKFLWKAVIHMSMTTRLLYEDAIQIFRFSLDFFSGANQNKNKRSCKGRKSIKRKNRTQVSHNLFMKSSILPPFHICAWICAAHLLSEQFEFLLKRKNPRPVLLNSKGRVFSTIGLCVAAKYEAP